MSMSCGASGNEAKVQKREHVVQHDGVSITIPAAWDGRVLFDDLGENAVWQAANFELPANEGSEPPRPIRGREDPIKSMGDGDVLISIADTTDAAGARGRLPLIISERSFLDPADGGVPRGHAIASESGCFQARCFQATVDFGRPPPRRLIAVANAVLASLQVSDPQPSE